MTLLSIENLNKSYGKNEVLKEVTLEVNENEIFAILGVNGAGKTTLLECIEGIRKFNSGKISIFNQPQATILKKNIIGVQLQSSTLPEEIKVFEALKLYSFFSKNEKGLDEAILRFGLDKIKNMKYKELSTGQKRKLHLSLALINNPKLLILDEPTAGLDVESRANLHNEIRNFKKDGKTILLASHDMAEVEELCDRVAIIRDGMIVFCGTIAEMQKKNKGLYKIHIKLANEIKHRVFEVENLNSSLIELLESLSNNNYLIDDIIIKKPSLEESFLEISKENNI